MSKDQFLGDETLKRAIAGMRDRLIHHYSGVDYEIVWDVASNKAPELKRQVEAVLRQESGA